MKILGKHGVDLSLFAVSYQAIYDDCRTHTKRLGVHVVPLLFEDLVKPETFQDLLKKLDISLDNCMLDWTLSTKEKFENGFVFQEFHQPLARHGTPIEDAPTKNGLSVTLQDRPPLIISPEFAEKFGEANLRQQIAAALTTYSSAHDLEYPITRVGVKLAGIALTSG